MSKPRQVDENVLILRGDKPILARICEGSRELQCNCKPSPNWCVQWNKLVILDENGEKTDKFIRWVWECDMLDVTDEGFAEATKRVNDKIDDKESEIASLNSEINELEDRLVEIEAAKRVPLTNRTPPPTPLFPCFTSPA